MLFKVGKAYFSEKLSDTSFNFQKRLLSCPKWWLIHDSHQSSKYIKLHIFQKMVKADVKEIYARGIYSPTILLQITHVQFSLLSNLLITSNEITSIQAIALLNSPVLTEICIGMNSFVHVRSLRKFKGKCMNSLSLINNPISQITALREWDAPYLNDIGLQFPFCTNFIIGQTGLSSFAALKSTNFQQIRINREKRVTQAKLWKMLEKKYGDQLKGGY